MILSRLAVRAASAALLCLLLASSNVKACCEDVLNCAAAVASAGLTCAVEAAISLLKGLIGKVTLLEINLLAEFDGAMTVATSELLQHPWNQTAS